ncbi:hypothetical protein [Fodinibius halophilus]|uniref:Outer membrane beta-barrel protein n=1 Tax=Fodinibius halophilus TaxID=1736908 RepID=A0A6M1TA27_9BACT|nr:hypothetical protein [Fodinibius halophilus]NGP88891.1 hypothetical protein [Fodinibius halophilus]
MFKSIKILLTTGVFIAVLVMTGVSQPQFSVGVKAGTMGVGGEITTSINKNFNARLSGMFFSYTHSGVYTDDNPDIKHESDLNTTSVGGIVDYFPFQNSVKLSGGLFYHSFTVTGDATPNESYTLDGKTFQPEELGTLSANLDYKSKIVPYAGIGIGNPLAKGSKLKFNVEIGTVYTNSPQVTIQGKGMIAPTAQQDQRFQDGLKDFKFHPVLNIGLSYKL